MDEKRAVIYLRTSGETLKANKGFGMKDQKKDCEDYCEANGLEVINTYCDDGVSGSDEALEKSHGLLELLANLNGGDVVIITKHSDRIFGRGEFRSAWVRRQIIKSGKRLVSTDQPDYDIYSADPSSVLAQKLFEAVAIFERMNTSLRLSKARKAKVRGGMKAAGKAPLGYKWVFNGPSKDLVIDEETAPIVKEIFKRAQMGNSCASIARWVSSECGINMKRASVYWILKNETYTGKMVYGNTEAMNKDLALIPKITFGKAAAALTKKKKKVNP